MGISHLLQISGSIRSRSKVLYICDTSWLNRIVTRFIFSLQNIKFLNFNEIQALPDNFFNYAIDATPPFNREKHVSTLERVANFSLIEKPLLTPINCEKMMSGYVLQHNDLVKFMKTDLKLDFHKVEVVLNTNLDFKSDSGWRSGKSGGVINEFLGHLLSVPFAIKEPHGQSEVRYEYGNKSMNVLVKYDDYIIECALNYGVSEVRKTSYEWKFMNSQGITTYDCYSVNQNEKTICSLSDIGSNCNFYLRGFDFSNQCQRLLNQKGDLMKSTALKEIDKIVSTISG